MTIVTEYDWESDTWTHHTGENAARTVWREAVQEIADKAKATLPDCAGRVDRAVPSSSTTMWRMINSNGQLPAGVWKTCGMTPPVTRTDIIAGLACQSEEGQSYPHTVTGEVVSLTNEA